VVDGLLFQVLLVFCNEEDALQQGFPLERSPFGYELVFEKFDV
jgi:hypothetical protein